MNAEIKKAIEDLEWWLKTNEENGVVYIPKSNLERDIERIKHHDNQLNNRIHAQKSKDEIEYRKENSR